jgi:putative transposase
VRTAKKTKPDAAGVDSHRMARKPRIVVVGVPHNVCMRANNRRRLFSSIGDRLHFLACLQRGIAQSECVLHQLTLMGNHVHLVAVPPSRGALSTLVARTCQRYAQRRNADRDASGKLFEERFYSAVIEDDAALMSITLYNDANAYAGSLVDVPYEHEWSTGPHHAGVAGSRIPATLWKPSRWYERLACDPSERARIYRELMLAYVAKRDAAPQEPTLMHPDGDEDHYSRRLERPDRSLAREISSRWPRKDEPDQ